MKKRGKNMKVIRQADIKFEDFANSKVSLELCDTYGCDESCPDSNTTNCSDNYKE